MITLYFRSVPEDFPSAFYRVTLILVYRNFYRKSSIAKIIGDIESRNKSLRNGIKRLCYRAGIQYRSPHKFWHGHVHYGQAHAKTQEDYKAISQNVMHSTTGVTDQFYSNMDDEEKKSRIDSMFGINKSDEKLKVEFKEFMEYLTWKKAKNKLFK